MRRKSNNHLIYQQSVFWLLLFLVFLWFCPNHIISTKSLKMNIIDQRKQLILRIFWQRNISGVPCNFGFLIGCFLATMIFLDMESLPETSPSKFPDSGKGDLFCPYQLHLPCCPDAKITQNRKTYIEKHPLGAFGSLDSNFIYDKNFKDFWKSDST